MKEPGQELETVRSAAKWLVAASSAVLAALVAGIQLSSLGRIHESGWRVPGALAAVFLGILAVSLVLTLAARVLVSPAWSLRNLAHMEMTKPEVWRSHPLRNDLMGSRSLLSPTGDLGLAQLYRAHGTLFVADLALQEKGEVSVAKNLLTDPASDCEITYRLDVDGDADRLKRRLSAIMEISDRIADTANISDTRRRYRTLVTALPVLGLVLASCIVTFVLAVAPTNVTPVRIELELVNPGATHS